ncbi:hypothetical protein ACO2Q1_16270 [Brevundimonas sp. VNH65]|uniref:hypothetical protein n=1 Tax=Brevundimonas sp. VNH65 TaxID=3400917 RepID=UPI003C0B8981
MALSLAVPSAVQAQSCYALRQENAALEAQLMRLLADYPGTSIVLGMCAATASSTYNDYIARGRTNSFATNEAMATFAACAGVGCMFTGYGNCLQVANRMFELGLRGDQVVQQMRRQGCPQ